MEKLTIVNREKTAEMTFSVLPDKRTKIVFMEEAIPRPHNMTPEQYLRRMNMQYRDVFDVEIPYHYFVSRSGDTFSVKEDHLKSPIQALGKYDNDILILTEGSLQNIHPLQQPAMANLLKHLYQKYGITPINMVFFPYDLRRNYVRSVTQRNVFNLSVNLVEEISSAFVVEMSMDRSIDKPGVSFCRAPKTLRMNEAAEIAGVNRLIVESLNAALLGGAVDKIPAGRVMVLPAEPRNTMPKAAESILKESASLHESNKRIFG